MGGSSGDVLSSGDVVEVPVEVVVEARDGWDGRRRGRFGDVEGVRGRSGDHRGSWSEGRRVGSRRVLGSEGRGFEGAFLLGGSGIEGGGFEGRSSEGVRVGWDGRRDGSGCSVGRRRRSRSSRGSFDGRGDDGGRRSGLEGVVEGVAGGRRRDGIVRSESASRRGEVRRGFACRLVEVRELASCSSGGFRWFNGLRLVLADERLLRSLEILGSFVLIVAAVKLLDFVRILGDGSDGSSGRGRSGVEARRDRFERS